MILSFLQVALGGAVGAMLRFGAGLVLLRVQGAWLPLGVLSVNILGSFLMGLLAVWLVSRELQHLGPLLMTGLLGGFTTFSAFSLETFTLYERGQIGTAALYVVLSVVLSLGGLILGVWAARAVSL